MFNNRNFKKVIVLAITLVCISGAVYSYNHIKRQRTIEDTSVLSNDSHNDTAQNKKSDKKKKGTTYIAYATLNISSTENLTIENPDVAEVNDIPEDRCLEIKNKNPGQTAVTVSDKRINVTSNEDGSLNIGNEAPKNNVSYYTFRKFTDCGIKAISSYDENVAKIVLEEDKRHIKVRGIYEGTTSVDVIDNDGKKGSLTVKIRLNNDGNLLCDTDIKPCK
ncbi:MAG: hypothetical protein Q4F66_08430 [Clostridium sp.]|nr:hypothetical protein [Clostridium sp.]